jgi:LasA protease
MKRIAIWFLLLLLPALACNLPLAAVRTAGEQKTLEAQLFAASSATAPASLGSGSSSSAPTIGHPLPGMPTSTPPAADGALSFLEPFASTQEYQSLPGDTLDSVALRFGVDAQAIRNPEAGLDPQRLLPPGTRLEISVEAGSTLLSGPLLPDSEVVYGPSAADFSIEDTIQAAGGYLSSYSETVDGETLTGAQSVRRAALETSINPRLLLAFLDYRSGWVRGQPRDPAHLEFPIGFQATGYRGLYKELTLVARELSIGYYGVRSGTLGTLQFQDGETARISPRVNAGTAALQVLFSIVDNRQDWAQELYGAGGFPDFYRQMMGDPWQRAAAFEPQIPENLAEVQPVWELPFAAGELWVFTGGPHLVWGTGSPLGALDFAPTGETKGCTIGAHWATAAAAGVVTRSERGLLVLDLDGDGREQTGWDLLYLHLANAGRVPSGTKVQVGDRLGHPSCEGGPATGRHEHIARKYNGEWIGVTAAVPFVLSGWRAQAGDAPYAGTLLQNGVVVTAKSDGSAPARIQR